MDLTGCFTEKKTAGNLVATDMMALLQAKNNFCAQAAAASLTFDKLKRLQVQVANDHGIPFGRTGTPTRNQSRRRIVARCSGLERASWSS
jgi:hypothetical protein